MKTIYFDMDGTIADLFTVPNWLEGLQAEEVWPYLKADPMLNMSLLARKLKKRYSHPDFTFCAARRKRIFHSRQHFGTHPFTVIAYLKRKHSVFGDKFYRYKPGACGNRIFSKIVYMQ